jgi:hypothetical protein
MAFPASNGVLASAVILACDKAVQMKGYAQMLRNRLAAGNVGSREIIDADSTLRHYRGVFAQIAAMPGIAAEAQAQLGTPTLDVAAEFNAMNAAIDNVTTWLRANFPVDGSGFLLAYSWGATGTTDRQFTPAQTAGLQSALAALIATVA